MCQEILTEKAGDRREVIDRNLGSWTKEDALSCGELSLRRSHPSPMHEGYTTWNSTIIRPSMGTKDGRRKNRQAAWLLTGSSGSGRLGKRLGCERIIGLRQKQILRKCVREAGHEKIRASQTMWLVRDG